MAAAPRYPTFDEIRTSLAGQGLLLDRLVDAMRHHGPAADRSGEIPDALGQAGNARALNLNLVPVEHGGHPVVQTLVSRTMLMEHLGYADAGLALALPGPGLAMPPVMALGSADQQAEFFRQFDSDTPRWGAFAITEPDCGSDATAMRTTAIETAHSWVLNGTKCFITNGARADCIITFATVNRGQGRFGIRAFVVTRDTPGFSVTRIERMTGLRASQLAVLSYADCEVPKEALLMRGDEGALDDAFSGAQHAWDYFRPLLSSVMVGTCQRVRDELVSFFEAGGLPADRRLRVAEVNDHIIELDRKITVARLLCHKAALKTDRHLSTSMDSSMAKAYASRVATEVTRDALELAGLGGVATHPSLEQSYRDAKAYDIMEGTGELQRLMIARAAQRTPPGFAHGIVPAGP